MAAGDGFNAFGRGLGQGATAGFGDDAVAKILAALPDPADPEGYSREYAAGSPEADYLQTEQRRNAAAANGHRALYTAGEVLGAAPAAVAGSSAAGSLAGGAGLLGRAAAQAGAGAIQGGISGAGHAASGERLKDAAVGAGVGGAIGAGAEVAAPYIGAAAKGLVGRAKGLWARLSEPALQAEPAMAGAQAVHAQGLPSERPTRFADLPTKGSIPPDAMPSIPKAGKTGIREAEIEPMEDLADASMAVQGSNNLKQPASREAVDAAHDAQDRLYRLNKFGDGLKKRLEAPPANDVAEPATGVRTVRPPRGKRAVPAGPKLPSERGVSTAGDEQLPMEFPKPQGFQHWLEGELGAPTKTQLLDEPGINAGAKLTFGNGKSAIYKPASGGMTWSGIDKMSLPSREAAAHQTGEALFGANNPVPKTVSRDIGEGPASLQEWVDNAKPAARVENLISREPDATAQEAYRHTLLQPASQENAQAVAARGADPDFQRTQMLDLITGNRDRHGKNLLLRDAGEGAPVAIDNGYAFGPGPKEIRVPFENRDYLRAAQSPSDEVIGELQRASAKKVAGATAQPGITKEQQRNALGRLRDLQYNPQATRGLDPDEMGAWARRPYDKRSLPTQDLMEIERLTGGIPSRHISMADAPKLEGKPLEGEQFSLTDLLNKLR